MKPSRQFLPLCLAAAALCARGAVPVTARDGAFFEGDAPVRLSCADGVALPEPSEADALAEKIAACGFNAVRLPDVSAPDDVARFDAFAAACSRRDLHLWADALVPALAVPPSPADVALIDDPFSAPAWTNALAEAEAAGFDPFLAAPWDPRLESLLQHRLRECARASNPATGSRRNENPAWALFGFSSGWRNAFLFSQTATNAPAPPAFFRDGFLAEWNSWLYNRYGSDAAAAGAGSILPGESVSEGTVAWLGTPFGAPGAPAPAAVRLRDQKLFLQQLYLGHARRLMLYFFETGGRAADTPAFARWGEGANLLSSLSDVRFAGTPEEGFPTISFFPPDGGWDALCAAAGSSMLVFPCAGAPETFAPWARFFRAAVSTNGLSAGFGECTVDRPDAAVAVVALETGRLGPRSLSFEKTGVSVRVVRDHGGDETPVKPDPGAAAALDVVVRLPVPVGGAEAAAFEKARTAAVPDVVLSFAFSPESAGVPASIYVRAVGAETGADVPFALSAAGPALRKRECREISSGADPAGHALPARRGLRLPAAAGQRLLVFPKVSAESEILKRLDAE